MPASSRHRSNGGERSADLAALVDDHALGAGIPAHHPAVRIDHEDRVALDVVEEHSVSLLALAEGSFDEVSLLLGLRQMMVAALRRLMSRTAAVTSSPSALCTGLSVSSTGKLLPSFRRATSSNPIPICRASAPTGLRVPSAIERSAKPSGMILVTGCPTSSSPW